MALLPFWFISLIGHSLMAVFLHLRNVLLSFLHSKSLTSILISAKTTDLSLICLSYPGLLSALLPCSSSPIFNNLVFFPQISQALGLITLWRLLFSLSLLSEIYSAVDWSELTRLALYDVSAAFDMVDHNIFFSVLRLLMGYR